MVNTNSLKKGIVLKFDQDLFEVLESQHYKPGKGQAFVRAKLRNVRTNSIVDKKLRSGEKVEDVFIEKKTKQFLYEDGDQYVFMDVESYEQDPVSKDILAENVRYLKEGSEIMLRYYESEIIGIELSPHVTLEVTYTEPAVKGDTATSASKPIQLETGYEVQAPLFINIGDKVKIDTRTGEYVERV